MLPFLLTLALADVPPPPGAPGSDVTPCTVEAHGSPSVVCVACRADHSRPDHCLAAHGNPGWRRACRGGGASVRTEVWCPDATAPDAACPNTELEPRALLGRLSAAQRECLERRASEGPDDDRRAASTLLIHDATATRSADRRRLFERHLALDPADTPTALRLATLLLDRGEPEAARGWAEHAIRHLADDPAESRRLPSALRLRALASIALHDDATRADAPAAALDEARARARVDLEAWRAAAKPDATPEIDAHLAAIGAPTPLAPPPPAEPPPAEPPPAEPPPAAGCGCATWPAPATGWLALLPALALARRRRRAPTA
jgi:uncharacterized protein (TIGR03382 family)